MKPEQPSSTGSKLNAIQRSAVDAFLQAGAIGRKIRRLRLKSSVGLAELSSRTGLSTSFLSQLERGSVVPTLRNLARIALAFNRDLAYFFRDPKPAFRISRAASRIRLPQGPIAAPFLLSESLGFLIASRAYTPCLIELLPGTGTPLRSRALHGVEFVYVIEGAIALSIATQTEILEASDAAWLDAAAQREYRCHGNRPARALIVTAPDEPLRDLHTLPTNGRSPRSAASKK